MINARRKDNENIVYMHIFTKKDTLSFETMWMSLEYTTLSMIRETSHAHRKKISVMSLITSGI